MIKTRLRHSNVLIVLDDVDDYNQLDALAGSHTWFGSGSRIIITTRDEHLLITHKVDHVCPAKLLSNEEAFQLFNSRAYNEKLVVKNYKTLSLSVVSHAAGLPLELNVLGSFLYDKDEDEWISTLARLKDIPKAEIMKQLKISYDGLESVEKELFLDIACFFRRNSYSWKNRDNPMEILEACGYHPRIRTRVLRQKSLITIVDGEFDMHDLVHEMACYIIRGEHPKNPEKHSRVWKDEEIIDMCLGDATMKNDKIEAIKYFYHSSSYSSLFCKVVSNMKNLRWLSVSFEDKEVDENFVGPTFLSKELRYINWVNYPRSPFPDAFQPIKLVTLNLYDSLQRELWKGYKHLPHLKVLQLYFMDNLLTTPDFSGLPCLQKLILYHCRKLQEIHPSLGKHASLEYLSVEECDKLRMFPTIFHMGKLKTLEIQCLHKVLEFPEIKSNMESLVDLSLKYMWIDALLSSIGERCANLISLNLVLCSFSKKTEANFEGLKHLAELKLNELYYMKMPYHDLDISLRRSYGSQLSISLRLVLSHLRYKLRKLDLGGCRLRDGEIPREIGELSNLQELKLESNYFTRLDFSLSQLTELKLLNLNYCKQLIELPKLPSGVFILEADYCKSLTTIGDIYKNCKWLCQVSFLDGGIITDGDKLLQYMLQGKAIENYCMVLQVEGFELAKGLTPPLLVRRICTLKLPENWCNDFSGFLICANLTETELRTWSISYDSISMQQVTGSMDFEDDVGRWRWGRADVPPPPPPIYPRTNHQHKFTRVRYVPFALLRHTTWWDETYKAVWFSNESYTCFSEFGVILVPRKNGNRPIETSTTQEESENSHYRPDFQIYNDSENGLSFSFYLSTSNIIDLDFRMRF